MMPEGDRLGILQVGKSRHDGLRLLLCQLQKPVHQVKQVLQQGLAFSTEIQAQIGRHLVIAGPPGVQFFPRLTNPIYQCLLYIHMNIFQGLIPVKFSLFNRGLYGFQARDDLLCFPFTDNSGMCQHACVSYRAHDVIMTESLVEGDRLRELFNKVIRRHGETTTPGFVCAGFCRHNRSILSAVIRWETTL